MSPKMESNLIVKFTKDICYRGYLIPGISATQDMSYPRYLLPKISTRDIYYPGFMLNRKSAAYDVSYPGYFLRWIFATRDISCLTYQLPRISGTRDICDPEYLLARISATSDSPHSWEPLSSPLSLSMWEVAALTLPGCVQQTGKILDLKEERNAINQKSFDNQFMLKAACSLDLKRR